MVAVSAIDDGGFQSNDPAAGSPGSRPSGEEIRAKIEANRQKRLAMADAMKREAGVVDHNVWAKESEGLAELAQRRIHSPAGRNMGQLYIVAHECGHIFLHGREPGIRFPPHVMELEAESYAHHAFRHYGMRPSKDTTAFARWYVRYWIEKDRADGIPIDPRAMAFANGTRSPYEPLREVPDPWRKTGSARVAAHWPLPRGMRPRVDLGVRPIREELRSLLHTALTGFLTGYFGSPIAAMLYPDAPLVRMLLQPDPYMYDLEPVVHRLAIGLVIACLFVLLKTMVRRPHAARD